MGGLIKRAAVALVVGTVALTTFIATRPDNNRIQTHVIRVVDGDTFKATLNGSEETIRMLLIDTPETHKPGVEIQPYGPEASQFTKEQLENKDVKLEYYGKNHRDKYGRVLAYVYVGDRLFNKELVRSGYARVAYVPSKNATHYDEMMDAEVLAKNGHLRIWEYPDYVQKDGFHPEVLKK